MILNKLASYPALWQAITGVLALCLVLTGKSCQSARNEQTEAYKQIALCNQAKATLQEAITEQNRSIIELENETEKARAKSEAELRVAEVKNQSLEKRIREIQNMPVVTCEDLSPIGQSVIEALRARDGSEALNQRAD